MIWHTRKEREIIKKFKGKALIKYGTDGTIRGKPVEVRSARKDKRYRIQKDTHRKLVQSGGSYIFTHGKKAKRVPAKKVSKLIGRGTWFRDRRYPHKFLKVNDIF